MAITEDTPEGGPEELQWKIEQLNDMLKRANDELQGERNISANLLRNLNDANKRFDALTSRLTVGVLRKAGYTVRIEDADVCDTCGEEY